MRSFLLLFVSAVSACSLSPREKAQLVTLEEDTISARGGTLRLSSFDPGTFYGVRIGAMRESIRDDATIYVSPLPPGTYPVQLLLRNGGEEEITQRLHVFADEIHFERGWQIRRNMDSFFRFIGSLGARMGDAPEMLVYEHGLRILKRDGLGWAVGPELAVEDVLRSRSAPNGAEAALADFNGDGRLDLYLPNLNSQPPGWVSLATAEGFSSPVPSTDERCWRDKPKVRDFDGDGRDEVAFLHDTNTVVCSIDADGALRAISDIARQDRRAAGDFDGDGRNDWVSVRQGVATVELPGGAVTSELSLDKLFLHEACDLNGDGRLDLLLQAKSFILVADGRGDGRFQIARPVSAGCPGSAGEWRCSNRHALYSCDGEQRALWWDGHALQSEAVPAGEDWSFADFDGDGREDLLVHRPGSLELRPAHDDARGVRSYVRYRSVQVASDVELEAELERLEDQPSAPLLRAVSGSFAVGNVAAAWGRSLSILANEQGTLKVARRVTLANGLIRTLVACDVDGDGRDELGVDWTEGRTTFQIDESSIHAAPDGLGDPFDVCAPADVALGPGMREERWSLDFSRLVLRIGPIERGEVFSTGIEPSGFHALTFGDFNGDGFRDVLLQDEAGEISLYRSSPSGEIVRERSLQISPQSRPALVDVDGDGLDDIVMDEEARPGELVYIRNASGDADR